MNAILNFILDVVLGISLGVIGVALSSYITAALVLVYLARHLAVKEAAFTLGQIAQTMGQAIVASLPVTIAAAVVCRTGFVPSDVVPGIAALLGIGILGAICCLLVANWLGMQEARDIVRIAVGGLVRGRRTGGAQ